MVVKRTLESVTEIDCQTWPSCSVTRQTRSVVISRSLAALASGKTCYSQESFRRPCQRFAAGNHAASKTADFVSTE